MTLTGSTWDLQYTHDGIVNQEVQITQDSPTQWDIQYFQPPGALVQEIRLVNTNGLGWVVWGSTGSPPSAVPTMQFTTVPVQDPTGATVQGTLVTQGGTSQVLWMGADGNLYACNWNSSLNTYTVALPALTSSQTTVAGVNVNVNVTNVIQFPGATANIGNPTTVNIGKAQIVLSNPPNISTWFGPVQISINGFTPNSFNISVGGFNLTPGDSDGAWRKYFNPIEELWWRNRLVMMGVDANNQPNAWQYDYQVLGALMTYDTPERFVTQTFNDRLYGTPANWPDPANWADPVNSANWPAWAWNLNTNTGWFDPTPTIAGPTPPNGTWRAGSQPYGSQPDTDFSAPDSNGIRHLLPVNSIPVGVYYQTSPINSPLGCPTCNGTGYVNGQLCPLCYALDHYGNSSTSNIRVTIADLIHSPVALSVSLTQPPTPQFPVDFYLSAPMFMNTPSQSSAYANANNPGLQLPAAGWPLVLAADYFKYGVNVGAWKSPVNPMLFPTPGSALNTQNSPFVFPTSTSQAPQTDTLSPTAQWWGTSAIASARVGIKDPNAPGGFIVNFDMTGYDADDPNSPRALWCSNSPWNLYLADVNVKLLPSKELKLDPANSQVQQCDLDLDILQGTPVTPIQESATSYLWGAILGSSQSGSFQGNDWLNAFNGRADPRVGNALRNMQNRQGSTFDFTNSGMDNVVQH